MNKQNIELGLKVGSLGVAFGVFGINIKQHQAQQQQNLDQRFNQLDAKIDTKFNLLDAKIDLLNQTITTFLIQQTKR